MVERPDPSTGMYFQALRREQALIEQISALEAECDRLAADLTTAISGPTGVLALEAERDRLRAVVEAARNIKSCPFSEDCDNSYCKAARELQAALGKL